MSDLTTEQQVKEKAKELVEKFMLVVFNECPHDSYCEEKECKYNGATICKITISDAKKCGIIYCDGIIKELEEWGAPYLFEDTQSNDWGEARMEFWKSVREQIKTM